MNLTILGITVFLVAAGLTWWIKAQEKKNPK